MKNIYTRPLWVILSLLLSALANAQTTANYSFTTSTTGSLTDMSSGTTQLIAADQDDLSSSVTNIGFDFFFQGVRYTQFSVNSNGSLRLGASALSTTLYDPLGQAAQALITAYGADQRTHAGDGKVHFKVTGAVPNRVLTVEWLNCQADFNGGGTADVTYQVRLYETTGVIEFVYGSMMMSAGGAADPNSQSPQFGFSSNNSVGNVGSVTAAQSGTPAPSYTSASASPVNNTYVAGTISVLTSVADGARRTFTFTPLTPADPTGLSFTSVTTTSITLNWTDNATNEVGYVIYRSTDGINYSFTAQLAAGSVSSAQSGLSESTTYYWKVVAVTEGTLSNALSGTQATLAAGNITSNGTGGGLWSSLGTWSGGVVPSINDNVTIQDGDVVTINVAGNAYSLTTGGGSSGILEFETTTARTLTVYSNVTIAAGGTFRSNLAGTQTGHNLSVGGNLTNNGTLDFSTNAETAGAMITFTGATNNTFGGSGAITDIRQITINKGTSNASIIELNPTNFTVRGVTTDVVVGGFLALTSGTIKISGNFAYTGRMFAAAGYTIPAAGGVWLNNPNFTIAGQPGSPTVTGLLRMTQGIYNIGTATGNSMGFSTNSSVIVEGGAINATGRFGVAAAGNAITYNQSGGTITVCTIGNASATLGAFDIGTSLTSVISISGGTIICQVSSTAIDYRYQSGSGPAGITGGTLQLGNASSGAAKAFNLRGVLPDVIVTNTSGNHTATMSTTLVNYNNSGFNITTNPGATFNIGNTTFRFVGTTFTNNGIFTGNGASSNFVLVGNMAGTTQTVTGTGSFTASLTTLSVQVNGAITTTNQVVVSRVNDFSGGLTGCGKLTIGNGGATTAVIQLGGAVPALPVFGFDVPPVFNPGTGGVYLIYAPELTDRTMGNEVPPSRTLNSLNIVNPNTITISGGDITTTILTMSGGNINTGTNTVAVGTGVASPGTFSYTNGTIIGKFKRWIAAGTGNLDFPVGSSSFKRNASINFTTASGTGGTLTTEWVPVWGGHNGLPLTEGSININSTSQDGYWRVVAADGLTGGTYTGTFTATGITGVTDYTGLVLIKRADLNSPWTLDGTHVAATGSNAIPVISRINMTGFSEFGVGGFGISPALSNANLSTLSLSGGTLSPVFASGTTSYTASVSYTTSSITATPTVADATATVTVNGAAVPSGNASGAIELSVGPNTITTIVTSQDGTTTKTYIVTVTRPASADADLSDLTISGGTLSPVFASGTTSYAASVSNATASITATPTVDDVTATVTVNGVTVTSGNASGAIALIVGPNVITTIVTAQDGTTTKTYTVTVTRAASADADLSDLVLSAGTLSPAFASGTTSYTASVSNATTSITATPTVADATATVTVNGVAVTSGNSSGAIALSVGPNAITTIVTAQDGTTTQTYTVTVTRAASADADLSDLTISAGTLSPVFASATTSYTASVSNATTSITATPTVADATATVTVNGVAVTSGNSSGAIALIVGPNVITTIVTAQDGTTTQTYMVTVTRAASADADLSDLTISAGTLSPVFASATTSYTASVSNATTSITATPTVADATATVTVNGVAVTSGNSSGAIALIAGPNTITTIVTAQDGTTTQTYTVTVTRAVSADADLSDLTTSAGTLSPVFASATTSYTASVSNATTSITATPTVADATATVTVNGVAVTSGNSSGAIALIAGPNVITTIVIAQDGTTTQTYTVTITRASVLPLILTGFTATNKGNDVELNWITSSEINVVKFEVETSENGSDFNKLAEVPAHGNSTLVQHYSFINFHPGAGDHYYRLRMIDKDGVYLYSKIVRIVIADQLPSVKILSNPIVNRQLNLQLTNVKPGKYNLVLVDMKGLVVYKQSLQNMGGLTTLKIQLPLLANGEYTVLLRNNINVFTISALVQY